MKQITVSALEFEALKQVDRMVRVAMASPGAAEGLVAAIQALDAVRREEAGDTAAPIIANSSDVAASLIERAMQQDNRQ
jgi:hypothetical protein